MKGAIAISLKELVINNYGKEKWELSLKEAGLQKEPLITLLTDVDDAVIMKIIDGVCKALNITKQQAFDAFGDYWVNKFAPARYAAYMRGVTCAKDMLLKMDSVHDTVTKNMDNARPPRFEYKWKDDKTLVMKYKSSRGLIDLLIGLIKGVGKYYKETLVIKKLSTSEVEIVFK